MMETESIQPESPPLPSLLAEDFTSYASDVSSNVMTISRTGSSNKLSMVIPVK